MIRREGYISVYALMVMTVLMILSSYLVYIIKLGSHVQMHTKNNIQAYYLAEGKIYMALYDKYYEEDFYPYLLEAFRENKTGPKNVILDEGDIDEFESLSDFKLSLKKDTDRAEIELKIDLDYKGINTNIAASVLAVNDFFEMGNPVLNHSTIDNSQEEEFYKLLNKIYNETKIDYSDLPSNTYGGQFSNFETFTLEQIHKNNSYLYAYRDTMLEPYVEHIDKDNIVLIINKYGDKDVNLILGSEGELDSPMELNGLIFVEGNITIYNNLNFNGIIIIKDGDLIVNSNERPRINGMVISSHDLNEENIQILYNRENVYKYGTYLSGFIEPKLLLIKNN